MSVEIPSSQESAARPLWVTWPGVITPALWQAPLEPLGWTLAGYASIVDEAWRQMQAGEQPPGAWVINDLTPASSPLADIIWTARQTYPALQIIVVMPGTLTDKRRALRSIGMMTTSYDFLLVPEQQDPLPLIRQHLSRPATFADVAQDWDILNAESVHWQPPPITGGAGGASPEPVTTDTIVQHTTERRQNFMHKLFTAKTQEKPVPAPAARVPDPPPPLPTDSAPSPPAAFISRRRLVLYGGQGGQGVTSVIALLAHRLTAQHLSVTLWAASAGSRTLGQALQIPLVDQGWERSPAVGFTDMDALVQSPRKGCTLIPYGAGPLPAQEPDDRAVWRWLAQHPADVLLIDGGHDLRQLGQWRDQIDGVIVVADGSFPGTMAAQMLMTALAVVAPHLVEGVLLNRVHSATAVLHPSDIPDRWHCPALGIWPDDPRTLQEFWMTGRLAKEWPGRIDALLAQLLSAKQAPAW